MHNWQPANMAKYSYINRVLLKHHVCAYIVYTVHLFPVTGLHIKSRASRFLQTSGHWKQYNEYPEYRLTSMCSLDLPWASQEDGNVINTARSGMRWVRKYTKNALWDCWRGHSAWDKSSTSAPKRACTLPQLRGQNWSRWTKTEGGGVHDVPDSRCGSDISHVDPFSVTQFPGQSGSFWPRFRTNQILSDPFSVSVWPYN